MNRLLARLDSLASTIVPVLYLIGLAAGTISYFTGIAPDFGLAVGVSLAIAAECHAWLMQRRMRAIWAQYTRARLRDDPRADALLAQVKAAAGILAALVLFSMYNAVAFVAATWHPIPGFLPGWLQIGIRASVIPVFFLLSGALAPLDVDAAAVLAAASHDMLYKTVRATVRQWRRRITRARRRGIDLAPVAIALMIDAGETDGARRIQMIADGLAAAEAGRDVPRIAPASLNDTGERSPLASDHSPEVSPDRLPDPAGEGVPVSLLDHSRPSQSHGVRLVTASAPPRTIRRRSDSGHSRADIAALWERDTSLARSILADAPDISTRELARRLSVGRASPCHPQRASTIRRVLTSETGGIA